MDSDSGDMQPESEDGDVSKMNPYPLEDKYIDEADRQRWVYRYHGPLRTTQLIQHSLCRGRTHLFVDPPPLKIQLLHPLAFLSTHPSRAVYYP